MSCSCSFYPPSRPLHICHGYRKRLVTVVMSTIREHKKNRTFQLTLISVRSCSLAGSRLEDRGYLLNEDRRKDDEQRHHDNRQIAAQHLHPWSARCGQLTLHQEQKHKRDGNGAEHGSLSARGNGGDRCGGYRCDHETALPPSISAP